MRVMSKDDKFMHRAIELALLAEREGNLYGGPSSVLSHLPPFFQERIENTQWLGPVMPAECDPLRERLLALEQDVRGRVQVKVVDHLHVMGREPNASGLAARERF